MKKRILLSILTVGLLVACKPSGDNKPKLQSIELSGDYRTTFTVGEPFTSEGLIVTANYSNHTSEEVHNYAITIPGMDEEGLKDVVVTYKTKSASYTITIGNPPEVAFPVDDVRNFLTSRGVSSSIYSIPSTISSLVGVLSVDVDEEDEYPHIKISLNAISNYQEIYNQLSSLNYNMDGDIFIDSNEVIGFEIWNNNDDTITYINVYAYSDLVEPDPQEDEDEDLLDKDFPLPTADYLPKETDNKYLDGVTYTKDNFSFSFVKNNGSNPLYEKPKYVALYGPSSSGTGNTMTISSIYVMKKIEFTLYENPDKPSDTKDGNLSVDVGSISKSGSITTWTGNSKSISFTALAQYRFSTLKIYYVDSSTQPEGGEMTVAEVYEAASQIQYIPSVSGWYLSDVSVTVRIKALDAIDTVTTSDGLDGNARGKVVCVDNTGWILISSGTQSNTDFYQRVKDYVKAGTTTYVVTGKIAFLNGVVEIKVDSYKYNSSLQIEYDLNDFVKSASINSSDSFMNHCKDIATNKNGYGAGEIIRLNGLTFFNKYRKAGSYYFLDRAGKLVPIYSLLDKDRSSFSQEGVYDIIGLETMYSGRPSLRVLEVIRSDLEPVAYDLSNAVEKTDTAYFYNINPDKAAYAEEYYNSVTTVYKMEVYVSRYTDDDYTFNTSYHYDGVNKEYTTGNSEVDAANHNSLGMSNENLDYNQTFYDYAIELAESASEVEDYKVTIYFTLALLKTVSGKEMWKANVFEALVPQLGA